jgi:hypothetical protein
MASVSRRASASACRCRQDHFRSAVTGLVSRVAEHSSVMTMVLVSSYFKT